MDIILIIIGYSTFTVFVTWKGFQRLTKHYRKQADDKRRSMDELESSEHRLRLFVEQSPYSVAMLDNDMRYLFCSDQWFTSHKLQKRSIRGISHYDVFPTAVARRELHKRCLAGAVEKNLGERFSKNGIHRWFRWEIRPWYNDENNIGGLILYSEDITEQKNAQDRLRENEQKFLTMYENSPLPKSLLSWPDGKFCDVNPAWTELFEYTKDEVLGKTTLDIGIIQDEKERDVARQRLLETGISRNLEMKLFTKSGRTLVVTNNGSVFELNGAKYLILTQMDITENKKLERQLAATFNQAGVGIGMTGLLSDTELSTEQRNYVETIRRSGETLLTVINDILDFSKIEAGKLEFETIDFELTNVIDEVKKTLALSADKKNIKLSVDLANNIPTVLAGDPGRLKQVPFNLVGNAIKFTNQGFVSLRAYTVYQTDQVAQLKFEIQDSGIGIPINIQKRLFQPFSQGDTSTQRHFGGTGLGLNICRSLIQKMNGHISFQSKVGLGSTFTFEVFFKKSALAFIETQELESTFVPSAKNRKGRILVAEDNLVNQLITTKMLQKLGYHADVVANGKEVLKTLTEIPYDLILMDCQMPEMDGYEASRAIRQNKNVPYCDIPILALTANAMIGEAQVYQSAGMNEHISKPVTIEKLGQILDKYLNGSAI